MPGMPIHNYRQISKSVLQADIGYITAPDLVGPVDIQVTEQIRINFVRPVGMARFFSWRYCLKPHLLHQPLNPFAVYFIALSIYIIAHLPGTPKGMFGICLVY